MNSTKAKWLGTIIALAIYLLGAHASAQLVGFTGKDTNTPDEFAFVALEDIPNGTQIFFTEANYDNSTDSFSSAEGHILFTVSGTLTEGTVVLISETSDDMFTVTGNGGTATLVPGASWIATTNDPHYAYSASNATSPWDNVTEIHSMIYVVLAGTLGTLDPKVDYPNALVAHGFFSANAAADYTGDRNAASRQTLQMVSNFTEGDGDLDLTFFGSVPVILMSFTIH